MLPKSGQEKKTWPYTASPKALVKAQLSGSQNLLCLVYRDQEGPSKSVLDQ